MNQIPIVEIFETIQGEGKHLGVASVFIRVGGCNLRCQFGSICCDTPYAVFTEKELDKKDASLRQGYNWHKMSVQQVVERIKQFSSSHIVWTGGEPMLYQQFIVECMRQLNSVEQYNAEIETNGTVICCDELFNAHNVTFNLSVKLKSSNQEALYDKKRINEKAIRSYPMDASSFKFVINDAIKDVNEIKQIIQILPAAEIFVMPQGMSRREIIRNSKSVVKICIENQWRFSPREHIIIWNTKKGV